MRRVLFVKKSGRISGGHIKFHDYFAHCVAHPELEPYAFLVFAEERGVGTIWESDRDRVVPELDVAGYDVVFIDGRDWELLPADVSLANVVHLIQDFRHRDADDPRFALLSRPALRICISAELADAVRPHANGPVVAIPNGIDMETFREGKKTPRSVVVWARKDRELGKEIAGAQALIDASVNVTLLTKPVAREEWARLLSTSEVFVGLTKEREGFYLPALEAMASRCAVVCADAIGNRSYCIDGETCRIARFGDASDHVRLALELLDDSAQRESICENAMKVAAEYTIERERELFYHAVEEHVLTETAAQRRRPAAQRRRPAAL